MPSPRHASVQAGVLGIGPRLRDVATRSVAPRLLITAAVGGAADLVMPTPEAGAALAILAVTLCFIFLYPAIGRVPSHVWGPFAGAVAMVAVPYLPVELAGLRLPGTAVLQELAGHLDVPILILCLAYLSVSLDESGFFNWCSLRIMRYGRGDGRRLLLAVFLGVSVLTFFTSNDIVVLAMTPILIHVGRNAEIDNVSPFLFAQFIAANTASMGLYIGNPTNIVIGNAAGIGFLQYMGRMAVPTLVATFATLGLVWLIFARLSRKNRVPRRYRAIAASAQVPWTSQMTIKVALFSLSVIALSALANPFAAEALFATDDAALVRTRVSQMVVGISVAFAVICAAYDLLRDARARNAGRAIKARLSRLPLEIVPFFLSFCVLLRGIEASGLVRVVADRVVDAFRSGPIAGSLASGAYGIGAVNLMNNIPATILFEKLWLGNPEAIPPRPGLAEELSQLSPAAPDIFIDVSLFAGNFGANLTFIGALAGLMWLRIISDLSKNARPAPPLPTARDFLVYGVLIVPAVTAITCLTIAVLRTVFA